MTKGKVVLVPFPFDDLSGVKLRPAVCLTNPVGAHRHLVVAFITSQTPANLQPTDVVLHSNREDFAATGLRVHSVLRLHRMITITASIIHRELGVLSSALQREVKQKLSVMFDLTPSTL